ncbi:MAG: putative conserved protein, Ntn-hydrolase superfamily [Verrucomicrobia bacterium]|jgi:uncharacterized Ntn-hydrolase superfamily protein|nr:MAG: putative conserved protein, Ntn-hydrolase superfamily [Verrucomicrobiota bacterium]
MPNTPIPRKIITKLFFCLFFVHSVAAAAPKVTTFSIIARDPATGEIGIAVQSRVPAVGSIVPWAQASAGAIATQAAANVSFGHLGLVLLRERIPPDRSLEILLKDDPDREQRQLALIDAAGHCAAFTGSECVPFAGHLTGPNFAVQGNLLAGPEVLEAMAQAFESSEGDLSDRLIAALRAGQAEGGDRRGKQSAALMVVREGWGYGGLNDRYRDLRVDDHPDPIEELSRILQVHRTLFPSPVPIR